MTSTPSKATAGPWEIVPLSGRGGPFAIRMVYQSDNPKASKTYYGVQGIGTAANAALVAAAPDLLAELRDVLEWALVEKAPLRDQEIKSIRAAISRATGAA